MLGARGGERMQGGKIYVTTYPCHVCARHIIAAGIHEVHYIEPYRKSMAIKLHKDAITESSIGGGKVRLIPFEGVSPTRYANFFKIGNTERKSKIDGRLTKVDPKSLNFKAETSLRSFPALEKHRRQKISATKAAGSLASWKCRTILQGQDQLELSLGDNCCIAIGIIGKICFC